MSFGNRYEDKKREKAAEVKRRNAKIRAQQKLREEREDQDLREKHTYDKKTTHGSHRVLDRNSYRQAQADKNAERNQARRDARIERQQTRKQQAVNAAKNKATRKKLQANWRRDGAAGTLTGNSQAIYDRQMEQRRQNEANERAHLAELKEAQRINPGGKAGQFLDQQQKRVDFYDQFKPDSALSYAKKLKEGRVEGQSSNTYGAWGSMSQPT